MVRSITLELHSRTHKLLSSILAVACVMSGETPKKVNLSEDCCYLCKVKISSLKEKIKIFGKSELDISALILRSVGIDLSVYVGSKNLAICRLCYNTLNGYKKALKKVDEIVDRIQTKFKTDR